MTKKWLDCSISIDKRVDALLEQMTLNEKIAQMLTMRGYEMYERISEHELRMTDELVELYKEFPGAGLGSWNRADWYSGRNWKNGLTPELLPIWFNMVQKYAVEETRLGIPLLLNTGSIHGMFVLGGLVLPTGIGLASTWNRETVRNAFGAVAEECQSIALNGALASGPTQDLARDPRWSRVEETWGEDPFLSAEMSTAFCEGILSVRRKSGTGPLPAIRHFLAYGEPEGGHNALPCHCGLNELYNIHLRPYQYAIAAGADNLMTSYNLLDGIPCTISPLIEQLLRKQWGWKGTVIADAYAIFNLISQGFANDLGEAAAIAVKAGTDFCCWEGKEFKAGLVLALERGDLTMDELDIPVRRILRKKMESGAFEHPYIEDVTMAPKTLGCAAHRKIALEAARESLVLLKNDNSILPLDSEKKIAVVGPNADSMHNQIGDYTSPQRPGDVITVRAGFERLGVKVKYARGCGVRSHDTVKLEEALKTVASADVAVVVLGGASVPNMDLIQADNGAAVVEEVLSDTEQDKDSGEGYDRASLRLGEAQLELLRRIKASGKKVVTVLIMGRPLIIDEVCQLSDAVLLAWYPGQEGGTAIAEAVLGQLNPSGRLPVSFPAHEGQLPVYYNALRTRPNYIDCSSLPQFQFGFGLSYTTFELKNVRAERDCFSIGEKNTLRLEVQNTGKMAGADVIELYIRDEKFSVARPEIELKGFQKVFLLPGESRTVEFQLSEKELAFFNRDLEYVVEPGVFLLRVSDCGPTEGIETRVTVK